MKYIFFWIISHGDMKNDSLKSQCHINDSTIVITYGISNKRFITGKMGVCKGSDKVGKISKNKLK